MGKSLSPSICLSLQSSVFRLAVLCLRSGWPLREFPGIDIGGSGGYHPGMASRDRYQRDPSEAQLRVMLEARQHELEAHRQRTSRTFSMILLVVISGTAGAIWLFPTEPGKISSSASAAMPLATAAKTAGQADPELKAFTDTSHGDSTEDVRFAMQLLNFVNPAATKTSPASQTPATAQAEAIIKAVADPALAAP